MEEQDEEHVQGYRSEGHEGKVTWMLNMGLGIGKKIIFGGFLISSAPLVLPPLLVISAIGFVVSLPSGIFMASYACSEKLMSKLLPMPESEEEPEEEEDIHRAAKRKIESVDELGEEKPVEERAKTDAVQEESNGYEEDVEKENEKEDIVVYEEEEVPLVEESGKEEPVMVRGVVLDVAEGGEENGEAKIEVTAVVIEENGGDQEKENGVSEEELKKETRRMVEQMGDEDKVEKDKTPLETPTSKGDQTSTTVAAADLPVSHRAKETPKDAGASSEKEGQIATSNEAQKKKNGKKKTLQQKEGQYDEEKIWEQIEGLRKIVGYKATLQKTSIEELKALYIFTGVEPPASFKEHSDLAEVDNKLQFLKSIIGVN